MVNHLAEAHQTTGRNMALATENFRTSSSSAESMDSYPDARMVDDDVGESIALLVVFNIPGLRTFQTGIAK